MPNCAGFSRDFVFLLINFVILNDKILISETFCNDNHFYTSIEYRSYKDKAVTLSEGKENQLLIFWEALCKLGNLLQQPVDESPFTEAL